MFSPCFGGFLPRSKDVHCRLIGISKLSVLLVSTFASHLQGWGFDPRLRHVCVEFACSPRASGVSSGYSGFLPQSKDMHCR
ncbi:hypothetical protein QTP70_021831, partial [Hemibagrus guttatus]